MENDIDNSPNAVGIAVIVMGIVFLSIVLYIFL